MKIQRIPPSARSTPFSVPWAPLLGLTLVSLACSQSSASEVVNPELQIGYVEGGGTTTFRAKLAQPVGDGFVLLGLPGSSPSDFDPHQATVFGVHEYASGGTQLELTVDTACLDAMDPFLLYVAAVVLPVQPGGPVMTFPRPVLLGSAPCERLDFDFDANGGSLQAGERILEQWADIGVHITAENKVAGHPDLVIIYDSSNPNFEDPDLVTPGYGLNNDTPLGNLMIVAENDIDADGDGLIDLPDDEAGGGTIIFEFDDPVTFCSLTLVDLDDGPGHEIRFYDALGTQFDVFELTHLGDNSVQTLGGMFSGVSRMECDFVSSCGIGSFEFLFCPTRINFDTSLTGVPLGLQAGTVVTDQFEVFGMHVSADSFGPHDQAILFDTNAPTGGDTDLGAAEVGLVLVIAEDLEDADGDGIVDDPDDEIAGGILVVEFEDPVRWDGATVLDIDFDESATFFAFDSDGDLITAVPVPPMGDGSVQTVLPPPVEGVQRLELHLSSSGALGEILLCPDSFAGGAF